MQSVESKDGVYNPRERTVIDMGNVNVTMRTNACCRAGRKLLAQLLLANVFEATAVKRTDVLNRQEW